MAVPGRFNRYTEEFMGTRTARVAAYVGGASLIAFGEFYRGVPGAAGAIVGVFDASWALYASVERHQLQQLPEPVSPAQVGP